MEEREGVAAKDKIDLLRKKYEKKLTFLIATYHPANLPGELQGKRQHWPGLAEERSSGDFPPLVTRVIRVNRYFPLKAL